MKQLLIDIEALDGAIRVCQPGNTPRPVFGRQPRMMLARIALGALREATAPMTLREVAEHVVAANGGDAADARPMKKTMEKVRTALLRQQRAGTLRSMAGKDGRMVWEVVR